MDQAVFAKHTWDEYVRGTVVSVAAANIMQRFLSNMIAATGKAMDDSQSEVDASECESELPPMKLTGFEIPRVDYIGLR